MCNVFKINVYEDINHLSYVINCLNILIHESEPFSTRPSDRDQIWHACADRDDTGSHLKKLPTPPQGGLGGYLLCGDDVWR